MTKRISMHTHDVDPRYGRTRDMLITPSTRITAEPAPQLRPGDLGVRLDGSGGPVDVAQLGADLTAAFDLLSAADLRRLKTILAKYCGSANTNQAGITSSDADPLTCGQDSVVAAINATNKSFWEKKTADGLYR
jgi:hypothetical protein